MMFSNQQDVECIREDGDDEKLVLRNSVLKNENYKNNLNHNVNLEITIHKNHTYTYTHTNP